MTEQPQIVEVRVGAGGDPSTLGLPVFAVASLALGMGLLGKPAGPQVIAPLIIFTAGLFQLLVTLWAALLGQSILAMVFGLFSGAWITVGCVLIGTQHGWFGIPAGQIAAADQLIFICYACLFAFLVIPCLRLPLIYPLIISLAVAALAFAAAGITSIAGYLALTFAFLGFYAWVHVAHVALGAKPFPPIGKPLLS